MVEMDDGEAENPPSKVWQLREGGQCQRREVVQLDCPTHDAMKSAVRSTSSGVSRSSNVATTSRQYTPLMDS